MFHGIAEVKGMQKGAGVAAAVKHFALNDQASSPIPGSQLRGNVRNHGHTFSGDHADKLQLHSTRTHASGPKSQIVFGQLGT